MAVVLILFLALLSSRSSETTKVKFSLKIHGCLDRCSNCQSYITINEKIIIFKPGVTMIKIQMKKEINIEKLHICNSNSGFFKMKNFLENDLEDTLVVAVLEKRCKSNIRPNWYQQIQQFRQVKLKNVETVGVYESAIIATCFGNCGISSRDLPLYRFEQPGYGPLEEDFVLTFQNSDITQTRVVTGDHISFLRTTLLTVLILVVLILISGLVVILKNILRKRTSLEREGETTDVNQNPNENQYLQPVDSEIVASSSWRTNQYDYPSCHTRKITYESRIEEREEVFGIDRSDYCILAKVEEDSGYQPLKKYKVYQEND